MNEGCRSNGICQQSHVWVCLQKSKQYCWREVELYQGWHLTMCDCLLFEGYTAAYRSIHAILTYSVNDRQPHKNRPFPSLDISYVTPCWTRPTFLSIWHTNHTLSLLSPSVTASLLLPCFTPGLFVGIITTTNFKEKIWIPQLYISKCVKHSQYEQINDEVDKMSHKKAQRPNKSVYLGDFRTHLMPQSDK